MAMNMGKAVTNNHIATRYRYERKFVFGNKSAQEIIDTEVLNNPFCFREIYYRRTVNNCYYDDNQMSFYQQNVAGDTNREKYRLRWYNDRFEQIENPTLEIKRKYGAVGDKLSLQLNRFSCNLRNISASKFTADTLDYIEKQGETQLLLKMQLLSPVLYNSYERRYFLSNCDKFRITIDYNIQCYNPNYCNYENSKISSSDVVLELKYNTDDDKEARLLSQYINTRLSKNSKYVRGLNLINHQLDI